ncbi:MAG: hypothetical protein M1838_005383 [Thelocarpon superellum]|nr:MAG: hypothetical protein M1838_005383 [Thelocarpon superellum]
MAVPRSIRILGVLSVGLFLYLLTLIFRAPALVTRPATTGRLQEMTRDPNLDLTGEPEGPLYRSDEYAANNPNAPRINATLLALVRNEELDGMLQSMTELEKTWNHKFNYPWTFFNDVEFSAEFKRRTQAATNAVCNYHVIPREHWDFPSWINKDLYEESAQLLKEQDVQYWDNPSYHQMCRWNSGMFYRHPALKNVRWYWRVEPKVHFFCDVDYDVFRWMEDHNKTYGFTINIYDSPPSIPTLWPETEKFLASHPEYLHPNNAMDWLTDASRPDHHAQAHGYSTCHFWSNFEIGDMDFWRGQAYEDYFNHLDRAGGFFYERWGDAPVHSIALGLFADASKIHWFRDIGYNHIPFINCPNSPKCRGCTAGKSYDGEAFLQKEDCRATYFRIIGTG